jgi:hypothetical protein
MLRYGRPAHRQASCQLTNGHGTAPKALQERAPGQVAKSVELLLMVSLH